MTKIIEYGTENPLERPELRSSEDTERIEFNSPGAGFALRAGASIPQETEGKVAFLERAFGKGNVKTTNQGEILVRDEGTGNLVPFDERGITVNDVTADIVGPAMQVVPGLIGTGGGVMGALGGVAVGTIGRMAATDLLTNGQSGETEGQRLGQLALDMALGGTSAMIVKGGAKVFDALRPRNFIARQVNKAEDSAFARKGQRLSEKTGVPLTLGEETGKRSQLMVESIGRRTPGGADMFYNFNQAQLRASKSRLDDVLSKVSPKPGSTFTVGEDVTTAFKTTLDDAIELRRAQARVDFNQVDALSQGQSLIPTNRLAQQIQNMVDELDVPGAGDATQRVVNQAKTTLKQLTDEAGNPRRLTAEQTQRLLQIYTNTQRGTGDFLKDMNKAQAKMLGGKLKDALLSDLDTAVNSAGEASEVALALRTARDHYKVNSAAVNELADSTLSRLIGNGTRSPEAIAEKLLRLHPSEIRGVMGVVDEASPATADSVRRLFVEDAMSAAREVAVSRRTAAGIKFNSAAFLSNLPDLETMKAAGFSRQQITEIGQVAKVLERVSDKAFEGSPTAFAGITWDAIQGAFTLNPVTIGRSVAAILTPRMIAKAVLTPEGRQALRVATSTSPKTKDALSAFGTLSAIIATEPGAQNVRPLGPMQDKLENEQDVISRSRPSASALPAPLPGPGAQAPLMQGELQ